MLELKGDLATRNFCLIMHVDYSNDVQVQCASCIGIQDADRVVQKLHLKTKSIELYFNNVALEIHPRKCIHT